MISFIASTISFFVLFPYFCYVLVFSICKLVTKKHRFSFYLALDASTIFFISSVHFIMQTIWGISFLGYILLVVVVIGLVLVIYHWRIQKQEINYKKVLRAFWRVNFLIFFCIYFILSTYGIIYYITESI
ncbi:DUF3397 domain-containing protein [Niallia nealsonii]|uniref:DUF3397 domain-containing protein n=1 Tax=Niallia nealsonii TaxID=115979 RepID=A0A2N0YY05_9BACI|nr:DUF3397 domain-containing protein [Niallia nealsonii]PKG22138.1 DUF3397 domain-containing protein [Niallia nealsonii]